MVKSFIQEAYDINPLKSSLFLLYETADWMEQTAVKEVKKFLSEDEFIYLIQEARSEAYGKIIAAKKDFEERAKPLLKKLEHAKKKKDKDEIKKVKYLLDKLAADRDKRIKDAKKAVEGIWNKTKLAGERVGYRTKKIATREIPAYATKAGSHIAAHKGKYGAGAAGVAAVGGTGYALYRHNKNK